MTAARPAEGVRHVDLPGSRELTIRRLREADAPLLSALYASLGDEDLYYRFFSGHAPPDAFVEGMTHVEERGGFGLVAVMEAPDRPPELVAEASCEPLPDGNGELGITVAPHARGWLGPYLLDSLVEEAAARGVPGLEADVLVMNRRMLALLQHRGFAVMEHSDGPATVRVVFSTTARVPGWPGVHDRPRLLVEVPGGLWRAQEEAQAAGLQVLACPGPSGAWKGCPALRGEPCPLVTGADLALDLIPDEPGCSLVEAHRRLHPSVPVCVQLPRGSSEHGPHPEGGFTSEDTAVIAVLQRAAHDASGIPPGGPPPS